MEPEKKKNNGKLTRTSIACAGYVEVSPGVYRQRQPNREGGNTRAQTDELERSAKKRPARTDKRKKGGKRRNQTGVQYQLFIISYRARGIDGSNCCPKYIEDACTEVELIPDDDIFHCPNQPIIKQIIGVAPELQRTEIFLFKLHQTWSDDQIEAAVQEELKTLTEEC